MLKQNILALLLILSTRIFCSMGQSSHPLKIAHVSINVVERKDDESHISGFTTNESENQNDNNYEASRNVGAPSQPKDTETNKPTFLPSQRPTIHPTVKPTQDSTREPTRRPTMAPSEHPTSQPTISPSQNPTMVKSDSPSVNPSAIPSNLPSLSPSTGPTRSVSPSVGPSMSPSKNPSFFPSTSPSVVPSDIPSSQPSLSPSQTPSSLPSLVPSSNPSSGHPSSAPSAWPSDMPSSTPSNAPSDTPSSQPSNSPSFSPSSAPSDIPSTLPSLSPTFMPTLSPVVNSGKYNTTISIILHDWSELITDPFKSSFELFIISFLSEEMTEIETLQVFFVKATIVNQTKMIQTERQRQLLEGGEQEHLLKVDVQIDGIVVGGPIDILTYNHAVQTIFDTKTKNFQEQLKELPGSTPGEDDKMKDETITATKSTHTTTTDDKAFSTSEIFMITAIAVLSTGVLVALCVIVAGKCSQKFEFPPGSDATNSMEQRTVAAQQTALRMVVSDDTSLGLNSNKHEDDDDDDEEIAMPVTCPSDESKVSVFDISTAASSASGEEKCDSRQLSCAESQSFADTTTKPPSQALVAARVRSIESQGEAVELVEIKEDYSSIAKVAAFMKDKSRVSDGSTRVSN